MKVLGLVALLLAAGGAPDGQAYALKSGELSYTLVHKLHEVKGTTHALEGRALALPDGTARVQVRAKVASFDSGNSNRDVHMREATHEPVHPWTSVKGTLEKISLPLQAPAETTLHATVELNGEKQAVEVPVKLSPAERGGVRATFSFPVSLEGFKVERPELLFVKVDDKLLLSGDLVFETE